jgi:hypothetical protein
VSACCLTAPLTYAGSVGNLGKALFHFRKLYLGQIFNGQELIAGSFVQSNQLIQFELILRSKRPSSPTSRDPSQ